MTALRTLSPRPVVLVDDRGRVVSDAQTGQVGPPPTDRRLGIGRLVAALPFNKSSHPVQLAPWRMLGDDRGGLVGDPNATVLGTPALYVHRLVTATRTPQTRR